MIKQKKKSRGIYFTLPEDKFQEMKRYVQELYMTQSAFIRYCIDKEIRRLDQENEE